MVNNEYEWEIELDEMRARLRYALDNLDNLDILVDGKKIPAAGRERVDKVVWTSRGNCPRIDAGIRVLRRQ